MNSPAHRLTLTALLLVMTATAAFAPAAHAQDATSLSGTVVDASGAMIPGATVTAKDVGTGSTFEAVTDERGAFTIPAMRAATYTVTVSLPGFKTAVIENVKLEVGVPATVKATLAIGQMEELVTVTGGAEIVQTQSSTVSTTMAVKQISQIPLVSRNAMDFVAFMPGAMTTGVNRDTTFNGLPQSALNVTLDGINIQDNGAKTGDGFQVAVKPLQDQIEEVTVATASGDASSVGGGSVQIMYRSRSGTNTFAGSVYEYLRNPALNANYWFNNRDLPPDPNTGKAPKDIVKLNQYGFRLGGPIVLPGLFDGHDKAFFFFNYERYRLRQGGLRQRTVLSPLAQQGIFQYNVAGQVRQVNLYDLARANGHTSTPDPVVADLLNDIREATASQGGLAQLTDPNLMQYSFRSAGDNYRQQPAGRVDVNLSRAHRLAVSTSHQWFRSDPGLNADRQFPGFVNRGTQDSHRNVWSGTLRSTLTKSLVSEAIVGYSSFPNRFNKFVDVGNFSGDALGSNQGGFNLGISAAGMITNATVETGINAGASPYVQVSDTLSWIKGSHSVSFGGSFSRISRSTWSETLVPSIAFGIDSRDPAVAMFTAGNFTGAAAANLTAAQNLYAVLTGRVTGITGNAVLDQETNRYSYLGRLEQGGRMNEIGFFVQDSWRFRPNLTLNYGLRWDTQLPFYPVNSVYSTASVEDVWGVSGVGNLFKPGVQTGRRPQFVQYEAGEKGFNTDWNNLAPNLGFAWRPGAGPGWRRLLGGEGDTVVRGGYGLSYNRRGMSDFTGVYSGNPGATLTANRNANIGNLGPFPVLFRERSRLGPGEFPENPVYPITGAVTASVRIFDPNLQTPYAQSWSVGVQRALNKTTAVEVRYVGTRHLQGWTNFNYNEVNIVENNFLNEFKLAQANLRANLAAGRGSSFAYFGAGTGTSPLPIYLAYLTGATQSGDAARYTAGQFTNTTFVNRLAIFNPNVTGAAGDLNSDAGRRASALAAGLPANFFVANPDLLGGATITGNGGYTRYNSLQVEMRRRLSNGFLVQGSYVLAKAFESTRVSFRVPLQENVGENDIRHAFKVNWVYELPFGNGRRFGSGASGLLEKLIGGWEFNGAGQVLSGDTLSFGNVRLVGMSLDELQDVYKLRFDDANKRIYSLPQDIIDNTIRAFSTSATSATGYGGLGAPTGRYFAPANGPDCIQVVAGDCAPRNVYVTGPMFVRFDMSLVKRIQISSRVTFELRGEALNAFNNVNFTPVAQANSSATINQVTQAYRDTGNTQDFGGRMVQLAARISW